ncbi:hypothetical protein [Risungbinella massiliensis]|uniref:hypothetical protein n=1 Tax=Risungbinella massiliensis TaxID=1329796 RepID=UPI0012B557C1|nr:hypothetical protein [Risungbinella massiliensis]
MPRKNAKKNDINNLIAEVGNELGVNQETRSINGNPKQFAAKMKKAIQKRT